MDPTLCARLLVLTALIGAAGAAHPQACPSGTYTYTFTSFCPVPIWIGQHSTGATQSYPPQSQNWALAPGCTSNTQCGTNSVCQQPTSGAPGQCTCSQSADCPGGAPCNNGLCANTATFCMPQTWSSGTFWPRTHCTTSGANLNCLTGQCATPGLLDCGFGNNGGSPQNPVTQLEVTTTTQGGNYDVSINAGYNVEMKITPTGGTPSGANCHWAGCTSDINAVCPTALQVTSTGTPSGTVIGCLDPCTQCLRTDPAALTCGSTITKDASGQAPSKTTPCTGTGGGLPTYQDMYCAKNAEGDGNSQASGNQGTPTAFAAVDCPVGTTFTTAIANFTPPTGMGVCIDPSNPNYKNAAGACSATTIGQPCGGYKILNYGDALGYTCQSATYATGSGNQTAYVCVPPITSGLATCSAPAGNTPLYQGSGGVFNAAWLTAGLQAGGGTTPYYQTFKTACPQAYTWQYDDDSGGFACTGLTGFDVTFCGSLSGARATTRSR